MCEGPDYGDPAPCARCGEPLEDSEWELCVPCERDDRRDGMAFPDNEEREVTK